MILIVIFSLSILSHNWGTLNLISTNHELHNYVFSCPLNKSDARLDLHILRQGNKSEMRIVPNVDFMSVITTPSNGRVGNILSAYSSLMVSFLSGLCKFWSWSYDLLSFSVSFSNWNTALNPSWPPLSWTSWTWSSRERRCPSLPRTLCCPATSISSGSLLVG